MTYIMSYVPTDIIHIYNTYRNGTYIDIIHIEKVHISINKISVQIIHSCTNCRMSVHDLVLIWFNLSIRVRNWPPRWWRCRLYFAIYSEKSKSKPEFFDGLYRMSSDSLWFHPRILHGTATAPSTIQSKMYGPVFPLRIWKRDMLLLNILIVQGATKPSGCIFWPRNHF